MSGGRSGPSSGGGGGSPSAEICELLRFEAWLQSLQPDVVEQLRVGDLLFVSQVVETADPNYRRVEARATNSLLVGSVTDQLPRLLACMGHGFTYVAEVLVADEGNVRVRVRRP
jgi:hypothetical protein